MGIFDFLKQQPPVPEPDMSSPQLTAGELPADASTERPVPVMEPIGTTGLRRTGGWVDEELLQKLAGRRAAKVYREMSDNSPIVGAVLFVIEMLLRQVEWRVEPSGESARQKQAAEFLDECFEDMSHTFDELIAEVLSMLPYGWSYFEIVFKERRGPLNPDPRMRSKHSDGCIGIRKISIRSQDTLDHWEFDPEGNVLGLWQSDPWAGSKLVFLPLNRCLLFRTTSRKNNPEGRSILRNAYRSWYYGKRIEEIEAIGIERDLTGLPMMELPPELMSPTATPQQKQIRESFQKIVQQIKRDEREGLVVPSQADREGKPTGYKFSLVTTGGRRAIDTSAVVTRHEQRIAMTMLAEFIFLGMADVGARSLADSKTSLFSVALGGVMESIAAVFNRYLVPRIMGLNGFSPDEYPEVVYGDLESVDLGQIAEFINKLVGGGVLTPDATLERKLREMAKLPQPDEDLPAPPARGKPAPTDVPGTAPAAADGTQPAATATAPAPTDANAATASVQDVALNGAQVTAAQGIIVAVAAGQLPRATGVRMLSTFFGLRVAVAEALMGEVGTPAFKPTSTPGA